MALTIYNTLTRCKETFQPLEPAKVKMYCCGVTVYDYCHLGHARSYIVWDIVRRYLEFSSYQVRYVQNFTDIDDKIINRANAQNISMEKVSQKYIQAYFEDIRRLNVIDASDYPCVTENIAAIHQFIAELERKNYAYAVDGNVYYKIENFLEYGKLSGKHLEDMQAGASGRVNLEDLSGNKKHKPSDFALWKAAKSGEPAWDSPWGMGRPGWHIECSAMIHALLGETIDIHGGGGDLVFPHHENEIAQSEVVTGKPLANYWMHNGMVTVNGEKMSKSLGNFTTIRELLERPIDPMVIRLFVLQAHYRKPLDFTEDAIFSAENAWETLKTGLLFGYQYGEKLAWKETNLNPQSELQNSQIGSFQMAMDDDFNTPGGLAVLFELAKELRREANLLTHQGETASSSNRIVQIWQTLVKLAQVFGLEILSTAETKNEYPILGDAEITTLIQQRQDARQNRNFALSDSIRDRLQSVGIHLIDQPNGETRWYRE
ncbi:cysteine--tRNA ligase [Rivularia sp. UHCC 0363]|uniref:cysteine--tRNA ligase n=1 Tax=Rivularia sp. UHCC 0363 TaxID=3110244 RepID=UPI002B220841|nr:cysteine--tRNA ligase [Rivularia sp. UHCC 0363]MEA5596864.1 cysteine--tRNA ligase [Rivularia sp. UHCC 0363]